MVECMSVVLNVGAHDGEVMYLCSICFRGELGFVNCDDICMCVVNKQLSLLSPLYNGNIM